jgi:hypothetical protein
MKEIQDTLQVGIANGSAIALSIISFSKKDKLHP